MNESKKSIKSTTDKGVLSGTSKIDLAFMDFNSQSIHKVPDVETFQKLLSISKPLADWYSNWSAARAAYIEMPQSFIDAGITQASWDTIKLKLPEINRIKSASAKEIEKKAKEFADFVKAQESKVDKLIEGESTELIKILRVNQSCLSFSDQMDILAVPEGDERDQKLLLKLEKLRESLLQDLQNERFKDPFVFGDFSTLLKED
uniref:Uncharacterized protein n=1 Tax=viral metagenome TaxID=1070528 RepID=A0A2V0RLZ8_9ZZZZ